MNTKIKPVYIAYMYGKWMGEDAPRAKFHSIAAAREWAEGYGKRANRCTICRYGSTKIIAEHRRDPSGDGTRWFKA